MLVRLCILTGLLVLMSASVLASFNNETDISDMPDNQLSDFSLPSMQAVDDAPLPNQSTGKYPAGVQPAQPLSPAEAPADALEVHLDLDFVNALGSEVTLEYQYFFTDVRRPPWKGQIIFENNNAEQTAQIPRSAAVNRILLFLRPAGAGSAECIPVQGQSPVVFNDMTQVTVIGTTDANGNYLCQLVYR